MSGTPQRLLIGGFSILMGAMIVMAAFDIGPMAGAPRHAPGWIVAVAGLLFVSGGVVVIAPTSRAASWAAGIIVVSLSVICAWVALFGEAEHFSGNLSMFSRATEVLIARVVFGLVALLGTAISANAVRRAWFGSSAAIAALRWVASAVAGVAVWYCLLLLGLAVVGVLDSLCPPALLVSGHCGAAWHGPAVEAVVLLCTALAAAGIILVPAFVAPSHRFAVALLAFVAGAAFAIYLALGGSLWGPFAVAAISGTGALWFATCKWRRDASSAREERLEIRRARETEAEELTGLARRAKASWNYPEHWLREWEPALAFSAEYVRRGDVFVAVSQGELVGVVALEVGSEGPGIEHLWVLPESQGLGVGRALFEHAVQVARERGWATLRIESDPNAQAFYERMGATQTGEVPAPVAGVQRSLPVLRLTINDFPTATSPGAA